MNKLRRSFYYAFRGLRYALRERNMRIHFCFAFYVILGGRAVCLEPAEWAVVFACITLVLAAECFNTAIEMLCDAVHPEYSEKIGKVKDISAASVLIGALASALAGCFMFIRNGRPALAIRLAAENPLAAFVVALSFGVWSFIIFRRKTND